MRSCDLNIHQKIMKLVDIARGHITIEYGRKTVTIYGEALLRGHGSPDFVVYADSIKWWDAPDDHEQIGDEVKNIILVFLRLTFLEKGMTLEID